ncbi:hypothetical protein MKW98_016767 [Papaver atlanticum]|uniref:Uncharacterized protein n=1 Tax=Papaver atlanticum TaxID=357466 RepID=A0AAD4TGP8_9MAGN|nr:hypothetical protein MKW98_016767 [Papaver atlanticum]
MRYRGALQLNLGSLSFLLKCALWGLLSSPHQQLKNCSNWFPLRIYPVRKGSAVFGVLVSEVQKLVGATASDAYRFGEGPVSQSSVLLRCYHASNPEHWALNMKKHCITDALLASKSYPHQPPCVKEHTNKSNISGTECNVPIMYDCYSTKRKDRERKFTGRGHSEKRASNRFQCLVQLFKYNNEELIMGIAQNRKAKLARLAINKFLHR